MNKIEKMLILLIAVQFGKNIIKPDKTRLPLSGKDMIKDFDRIFKGSKTEE